MDRIRLTVYLFLINYMQLKHEFSENMNSPQFSAKTNTLAVSFDIKI